MKKYVWIRLNNDFVPSPYAVIECNDQVAKKISRKSNDKLWKFLADLLHNKYPERVPKWFECYGKRYSFWYGYNGLEDYNEVYERMTKERMEELRDKFNNKDDLRCEAEWQVWEILESLPVFVI